MQHKALFLDTDKRLCGRRSNLQQNNHKQHICCGLKSLGRCLKCCGQWKILAVKHPVSVGVCPWRSVYSYSGRCLVWPLTWPHTWGDFRYHEIWKAWVYRISFIKRIFGTIAHNYTCWHWALTARGFAPRLALAIILMFDLCSS